MANENQESPVLRVLTAEHAVEPRADLVANEQQDTSAARALVQQMVNCGEWPPPELLQEIVNMGDAAVEPLLDLIRARPQSWPALDSLSHAIGLLSVLHAPAAIPELVKVLTEYDMEPSVAAANALVDFGSAGFDALIDLCTNPSIKGYQRADVLSAAAEAAGDDPARRSRLGEIAREFLDQAIASAREELKTKGFLEKVPPDSELDDDEEGDDELDDLDEFDDDFIEDELAIEEVDLAAESPESLTGDDEDFDDDAWVDDTIEPFTAEALGHVVQALAIIADPLARDTIMTAFDEGLVDEYVITRECVIKEYDDARPREDDLDDNWLSDYLADYADHIESLRPPSPPAKPATIPRPKYRYQDRYDEGEPPPDVPATQPIRNNAPRVGRNDPCWCGSGKKYKKCHLGKDTTA